MIKFIPANYYASPDGKRVCTTLRLAKLNFSAESLMKIIEYFDEPRNFGSEILSSKIIVKSDIDFEYICDNFKAIYTLGHQGAILYEEIKHDNGIIDDILTYRFIGTRAPLPNILFDLK